MVCKAIAISILLCLASFSVLVSTQQSKVTNSLGISPGCRYCPRIRIGCFSGCKPSQTCKIYPRTCGSCARAECVKKETPPAPPPQTKCVVCPKLFPACNIRCRGGFNCEMKKQTCSTCAHFACVPFESATPTPTPTPTPKPCLICPQFIAVCNLACKKGFKCETLRQTCTSCSRNACVPDDNPTNTTPDDPKLEASAAPENDAPEIHNDVDTVRDPIDDSEDPEDPVLY